MGGDWNLTLEPDLDTSGRSSVTESTLSRLKREFFQAQLIEPWRILNPTAQDFLFFSTAHNTYSLIYFFKIKHRDLSIVKKTSIEIISLSDHAPVTMVLAWGRNTIK